MSQAKYNSADKQTASKNKRWTTGLDKADPFVGGLHDLDGETKSKIFQEITMKHDPTIDGRSMAEAENITAARAPDLVERAAAQRRKPNRFVRPVLAISAAAVVLVAVVLGVSLIQPESASAEMLAVAQESVDAAEGEISVTAELAAVTADGDTTLPGGDLNVSGTLDFDYEGDNYAFAASIDDGSEGYTPKAIYVDDELYASEDGQDWVNLGSKESAGFAQLATQIIPGVQNFDSTALEQLVLVTEDITKSEKDGVVTYRGNIITEKVLALDASKLPATLLPFRLAEQGEMPLPPELGVEMAIIDRKATVITITMAEHEVDGVVVQGTVTADYSKVGEPQAIAAPSADRIQSIEDLQLGE